MSIIFFEKCALVCGKIRELCRVTHGAGGESIKKRKEEPLPFFSFRTVIIFVKELLIMS
jgi:hypothetical protein